jgi:hypothetical protein
MVQSQRHRCRKPMAGLQRLHRRFPSERSIVVDHKSVYLLMSVPFLLIQSRA